MKTKMLLVLVLFALVLAPPVRAEDPLGPAEYTSIDELALVIAGYFPKLAGGVTAVQNGTVTIDLGAKDGIKPNMVLSLWRPGKELLHPVTKAVLGRAEIEVGAIEVTIVAEASATARMKHQLLPPQTGDLARISPRKINIAVVPLRNDRPEIIEGLVERLGELGRFTVLEPPKVAAFLQERTQRDASLVREIGTAFALDAVVTVAILPTEDKQLITARIFYSDEAQPLDTIVATLSLTSKREALGDIRPFFAPLKPVAAAGNRMPDLPVAARYFAIADVDGDGTAEFCFSDARAVTVYKPAEGGWSAVASESVPGAESKQQQIWIDAADINGNGKAEVFVSRMLNGKVSSYALELRDGAFQRIAEAPGFLRVLSMPGRKPALLGQDYSAENLFSGSPKEYQWDGSIFAAGPALPVAKGVNLLSLAVANLGEAQPLVVTLDKDDIVALYSGDARIWKSEEEYPAVTAKVVLPRTGLESVLGRDPSNMDTITFSTGAAQSEDRRTVRLPGRILAADLSGKGVDDVIVAKNDTRSLVGGYGKGELHGLAWTGARLNPRWSIKDIDGSVLDIGAGPGSTGKTAAYALVKKDGGLFKKDVYWLERYEER
jgi:hypothetical protein